MKNARTKESRNRNARSRETAATVTGRAGTDGGSVRSNDGNEQTITRESNTARSAGVADEHAVTESSGGHTGNEIASGYYFTPRGDIEPIPDGCYVDKRDGRLKRRRNRSTGNNTDDGNEDRANNEDREQASDGASEFSSQTDIRKPLKVRGRRKKNVKEENKKLTMVTLLASGASALFTSVALLTKHEHWQLRNDCKPTEAAILAEAINDALDTLPVKYYDIVTSIVEKWIPWINLCFVLSALIYDRIEQSEKLIEATRYQARNGSDKRYTNGAEEAGNVGGYSSVGFGN